MTEIRNDIVEELIDDSTSTAEKLSRNQTAIKAINILLKKDPEFCVPTPLQQQNILVAFAYSGLVLYGRAYDIIKCDRAINLDSLEDIRKNIDKITIFEIKSTSREMSEDFAGYFFALTTAELLVAQNLKDRYKFIFVNTKTERYIELTLKEIFEHAKSIYPTWSIRF